VRSFLKDERPRALRFTVRSLSPEIPLCGAWWPHHTYQLKVFVNELEVLDALVPSKSGRETLTLNRQVVVDDVSFKHGGEVSISVRLQRNTWAWIDSCACLFRTCGSEGKSGQRTFSVTDLFRSTAPIPIRLEGDNVDTTLHIQAVLGSEKPTLPEWKED
jgi:hypothetical protein